MRSGTDGYLPGQPARVANRPPVGPSGATRASSTMIRAPSSTVWVPRWPLKSVAVQPGSTALTRKPGSALAYWTISMVSAALGETGEAGGGALSRWTAQTVYRHRVPPHSSFMGDVRPIPRLGGVVQDARGAGRALRVSWHAEDGLVVLSLWDGARCTGTARLAAADVPALIEALRLGLPAGPEILAGPDAAAG